MTPARTVRAMTPTRPAGAPPAPPPLLDWNPPTPRQLPELRRRLVEWTTGGPGVRSLSSHLVRGTGSVHLGLGVEIERGLSEAAYAETAALLCADEGERLDRADLYYATGDMTALARGAGHTLPDMSLAPEDLPSTHGLIVYGESIGGYLDQRPGLEPAYTPIVAASWGPWRPERLGIPRPRWPGWSAGVRVTLYSPDPVDLLREGFEREFGRPPRTPAEERMVRTAAAPLCWDSELINPFWKTDEPIPDDDRSSLLATVRATWLLMSQSLRDPRAPAQLDTVHADRAARRRLARAGDPAAPVRIVTLRDVRRPTAGGGSTEGGRDWSCRWMVSGHWRDQPYASQGAVRRIWINPYPKGPEDKPLRVRPTVKVWRR